MNDSEYKAKAKEVWQHRMVKKYGSLENVRAEMVRRRALVKNPGYFNKISQKEVTKFAKMGGIARHANNDTGADPIKKESA